MKKSATVALAVLGVLVLAGVGAFTYLSQPVDAAAYEDPVNAEAREQNTALTTALAFAGVDSAFVAVSDAGRVYVGYDVPTGEDALAPADYQRVVLGTAAQVVPGSGTIIARQFVDEVAATEWRVDTADVLAYQDGTLTAAALESAVTKTTL